MCEAEGLRIQNANPESRFWEYCKIPSEKTPLCGRRSTPYPSACTSQWSRDTYESLNPA